jgi:hydroxymethylpyrimidine pyrophosphatase-like HAD family hydrolase
VKVATLIPGSIEVVPRTLKKGNIVTLLLKKIIACRGGRLPAMITVMGDQEIDDGMFEAVFNSIAKSPPSAQLRKTKTFCISVGKRYSPANYYVNDVAVRLMFSFLFRR